ncbi:MAG: endonuclease domain-containing protein [Acidimicrobiia bacterium]
MARPRHFREAHEFAQELRLSMSWSERRLWQAIKMKQLGVRFRRQVPVGPFVVDFACLNPKIAIEVDGRSHDYVDESGRTRFLQRRGFVVIRFDNEDVRDALEWVCDQIRATIADALLMQNQTRECPPWPG